MTLTIVKDGFLASRTLRVHQALHVFEFFDPSLTIGKITYSKTGNTYFHVEYIDDKNNQSNILMITHKQGNNLLKLDVIFEWGVLCLE
jgi:hypothetical protein